MHVSPERKKKSEGTQRQEHQKPAPAFDIKKTGAKTKAGGIR